MSVSLLDRSSSQTDRHEGHDVDPPATDLRLTHHGAATGLEGDAPARYTVAVSLVALVHLALGRQAKATQQLCHPRVSTHKASRTALSRRGVNIADPPTPASSLAQASSPRLSSNATLAHSTSRGPRRSMASRTSGYVHSLSRSRPRRAARSRTSRGWPRRSWASSSRAATRASRSPHSSRRSGRAR